MGVLGSGRLANTTSTYSSCSRSREAFRPGGGGGGHRLPGPPPEPEAGRTRRAVGGGGGQGRRQCLCWDVGGPSGSPVAHGVTPRAGQVTWRPRSQGRGHLKRTGRDPAPGRGQSRAGGGAGLGAGWRGPPSPGCYGRERGQERQGTLGIHRWPLQLPSCARCRAPRAASDVHPRWVLPGPGPTVVALSPPEAGK